MPPHRATSTMMVDQMAGAIAEADGGDVTADPERYHRVALAALKPLMRPTDAMIDAAHEAVWFDAGWAIHSRADFKKAVRAMAAATIRDSKSLPQ